MEKYEKEILNDLKKKYEKQKRKSTREAGMALAYILITIDRTIIAAVLCAVGTKICMILGILSIIYVLSRFRGMEDCIRDVVYGYKISMKCFEAIDLIDKMLKEIEKDELKTNN